MLACRTHRPPCLSERFLISLLGLTGFFASATGMESLAAGQQCLANYLLSVAVVHVFSCLHRFRVACLQNEVGTKYFLRGTNFSSKHANVPKMFEPLVGGSEKSRRIPAKFPSPLKHHRRSSAGAQGEHNRFAWSMSIQVKVCSFTGRLVARWWSSNRSSS